MTTPQPDTKITKLIEASSLGTPGARAVRRTVKPTVAASLVARATARAQMRTRPNKLPKG